MGYKAQPLFLDTKTGRARTDIVLALLENGVLEADELCVASKLRNRTLWSRISDLKQVSVVSSSRNGQGAGLNYGLTQLGIEVALLLEQQKEILRKLANLNLQGWAEAKNNRDHKENL